MDSFNLKGFLSKIISGVSSITCPFSTSIPVSSGKIACFQLLVSRESSVIDLVNSASVSVRTGGVCARLEKEPISYSASVLVRIFEVQNQGYPDLQSH